MLGRFRILSALTVIAVMGSGCMNGMAPPGGGDSTGVSDLAAKALDVAQGVGGDNGFGGSLMDGYVAHMPGNMGFYDRDDLASEISNMMVLVRNESDQDGTFHVSYIASHMGLEDQMLDVAVLAGEEVLVEIPCAEIVGIGPLGEPGATGFHFADGETVDNMMAVPGFLGQDFACSGVYECVLSPDVDDLDGDGDTEELIILSDAMEFHMTDGGPAGHMDENGFGFMGSHMGGSWSQVP